MVKMKGCRTITKEEVNNILSKLNIRNQMIVYTGLYFGLRISETLSLRFKDVEGSYLSVNSKKHSDNVTFPIPPEYKKHIESLRQDYINKGIAVTGDTYLFLSREGENKPIHKGIASKIILDTCRELGIEKVGTHSFRKNFVTAIYEKTSKDIALTKKYSRHRSMANLDYYIQTSTDLNLVTQLSW